MHIRLNKGILKGVLCVVVAALLGILIFQLLNYWNNSVGNVSSSDKNRSFNDGRIMVDGNWYIPKKNLQTILVAGIDKFDEQMSEGMYLNGQQADFLMLIVVDVTNDTLRAVSINRDTMTTIQRIGVMGEKTDKFIGQVSLSHAYGTTDTQSGRNMVEAVENILYGTQVDHYITLSMDAIAEINDFVGGISLICKDDFSSIHPEMIKGERVTLNGDMALMYVRSRGELADSTNLSRMERQNQYIQAFFQKAHNMVITEEDAYTDLIDLISTHMTSDCTVNQLKKIYKDIMDCENIGFESIEGEAREGEKYVEFYPDEEKLLELVTRLFYNKEK